MGTQTHTGLTVCISFPCSDLSLANKSSKQNSGDLIHHSDQLLFLNFPLSGYRKEITFLYIVSFISCQLTDIFFLTILSKKDEQFQEEIKK